MTAHFPERSLLANLYRGRLRWDLVDPFPTQDARDRRTGNGAIEALSGFLRERVDPARVDRLGLLPEGLIDELGRRGCLKLRVDPELGGLGLSSTNAFRMIEAAASWSSAIGYVMSIQAGLGAAAYLPLLREGPLRDLIRRRVEQGALFADADTEPAGAANSARQTVATPTGNGTAYLLTGEKISIGNGPVADLVSVSATVRDGESERVRVFFVDAGSPGFRVEACQEFMGLKGFPIAALTLNRVRVPRERMLVEPDDQWRLSPSLTALWARGRLYVISATALAIAKLCLHWSREFAVRRVVDGRRLGAYDAIQHLVASSLAEVFALESVIEWCLLGEEREGGTDLRFEHQAAKNISSVTCWRIVDRTMSLLAAEGCETASSKARRGAQPLPLERFFRDARILRIAGGVDFLVDSWGAQSRIFPFYYQEPRDSAGEGETNFDGPDLTDRNRGHLRHVTAESRRFAQTCRRLSREHPDPGQLFEREHLMGLLSRIVNELFTMTVTLARAAGRDEAQALADTYCAAARHRLAGWWREIAGDGAPHDAAISDRWLAGRFTTPMLDDVITAVPPTAS